MARPSKVTSEWICAVVRDILAGSAPYRAAVAHGLSPSRFARIMRAGRLEYVEAEARWLRDEPAEAAFAALSPAAEAWFAITIAVARRDGEIEKHEYRAVMEGQDLRALREYVGHKVGRET